MNVVIVVVAEEFERLQARLQVLYLQHQQRLVKVEVPHFQLRVQVNVNLDEVDFVPAVRCSLKVARHEAILSQKHRCRELVCLRANDFACLEVSLLHQEIVCPLRDLSAEYGTRFAVFDAVLVLQDAPGISKVDEVESLFLVVAQIGKLVLLANEGEDLVDKDGALGEAALLQLGNLLAHNVVEDKHWCLISKLSKCEIDQELDEAKLHKAIGSQNWRHFLAILIF